MIRSLPTKLTRDKSRHPNSWAESAKWYVVASHERMGLWLFDTILIMARSLNAPPLTSCPSPWDLFLNGQNDLFMRTLLQNLRINWKWTLKKKKWAKRDINISKWLHSFFFYYETFKIIINMLLYQWVLWYILFLASSFVGDAVFCKVKKGW